MKTKLLIVALVAIFATNGAIAQEKSDIRAMAGLTMGTESNADETTGEPKLGFGITLGGEYFFIDKLSLAPSFTFYFVSNDNVKLSVLNVDARYYFTEGSIQAYGLVGLAHARTKIDFGSSGIGLGNVTTTNNGLNIGGGALFAFAEDMGVNVEAKWQTAGDGQLAFGVGFVYMF